jgi:phytoene/squalene synthetase
VPQVVPGYPLIGLATRFLERSEQFVQHGLDVAMLRRPDPADSAETRRLVCELCAWAGGLMLQGAPLALRLPGRAGWELRLVVQGGLRILEKIAAMDHATLQQRPKLTAFDLPLLLWRAARMRAGSA